MEVLTSPVNRSLKTTTLGKIGSDPSNGETIVLRTIDKGLGFGRDRGLYLGHTPTVLVDLTLIIQVTQGLEGLHPDGVPGSIGLEPHETHYLSLSYPLPMSLFHLGRRSTDDTHSPGP